MVCLPASATLLHPWVLDGILIFLEKKGRGSNLSCCTVTWSVVLFQRRCNPGAQCLHFSVMVMMKMMLTVERLHLFTSQNQEVAIFHVSLTGTSAPGRCTPATIPKYSRLLKPESAVRSQGGRRGYLWDWLRFSCLGSLQLLPHSVLRVQEVVTWSPLASALTEVLYHQ